MHSSHETLFSCTDTHLPDSHNSKHRFKHSLAYIRKDHKDILTFEYRKLCGHTVKKKILPSLWLTCKMVYNKGEKTLSKSKKLFNSTKNVMYHHQIKKYIYIFYIMNTSL